ncbi:restriction endonuclease [Bacillus cereus]|uniref:restriction endonuclease n=3 Tax=Bacillus cereus group TaxID=86661 RepID=UPI003878F5DA
MESEYKIYAVKASQPEKNNAEKIEKIGKLYASLKSGKARFGWSYYEDANLKVIKNKMERLEMMGLTDDEKVTWSRGKFLLNVTKDDYLVYVNMPSYGECTIVQVKGTYDFDYGWDDKMNDFAHFVPCTFLYTFNRRANIVHPFLQKRLSLMGSSYQIYAKAEFEELLESLNTNSLGQDVSERLNDSINNTLVNLYKDVHHLYPAHALEKLIIEVLKNVLPYVVEIRKGPDVNGSDIDVELEIPIGLGENTIREKWAVQVKSYHGVMDTVKAVEDLDKAFELDSSYTRGMIVSTASEMTETCEDALTILKEKYKKDVLVLMGQELAYAVMQYHMSNIKEITKD